MARISILKGTYTNAASDFRESYPRNMVPVVAQTGLSEGYLRPAEGLVALGTGPGITRGGINWREECYRVMGTKLVNISSAGVTTEIGDVGAGEQVSFDYSFNVLAVASGGTLYYWNGLSFTEGTDPDFGNVIDVIWVDGYFMFTDGTTIGVTELDDIYVVNPLKYGSSEVDPDEIKCLLKLRNEVYVVNRNTIEVFQNIGGSLFPFQRINGAQTPKGAIGRHCATVFLESIVFIGGARNEPPAVWITGNGSCINISTREIDLLLKEYSTIQLSNVVIEARVTDAQKLLYVHLPDQTLVYDAAASQVARQPIWYILTSSVTGLAKYRGRDFVWCYDKWLCGDAISAGHGYASNLISSHFGAVNGWDFTTAILYNEGNSAIFHELELVCLTGRVPLGVSPTIWTSYTVDGLTWSQEKPRTLGMTGDTLKRITWYQQGFMRNWRCQKFRGTSDAHISVGLLSAKLEGLNG